MKSTLISEPTSEWDGSSQAAERFDLLSILAVRSRFILWFTLGAAVLTIIIVLLIPNKYTAATVVLPPTQTPSMSSALLGQMSGGSNALASLAGAGLGIKNPAEMYVSLFRGRTVEDALINEFGLMARYKKKNMVDARIAFEDRSAVVLGVKDGLIRITFTDKDPNFAAKVANAYVEEFHKHSDTLAITEAAQRRAFFQQQLLEVNGNLAKAEESLKQTQRSTGVLQLDSQARSAIESAAVLRGQITAKEVQLQGMRSYATEDNPRIKTAEEELAALESQLAKLTGDSAGGGSDLFMGKSKIPEAGMQYLDKVRDVRYYETIELLIAKQFEAAKIDEARQGAIIQVADYAVPPDKKSSPHRALLVVLMTLLGFVVAVLWTVAAERWKEAMRDPAKHARVRGLRSLVLRRR